MASQLRRAFLCFVYCALGLPRAMHVHTYDAAPMRSAPGQQLLYLMPFLSRQLQCSECGCCVRPIGRSTFLSGHVALASNSARTQKECLRNSLDVRDTSHQLLRRWTRNGRIRTPTPSFSDGAKRGRRMAKALTGARAVSRISLSSILS